MGREKKPEEREFNVQVGARICRLRREFGVRQSELAKCLGVSSSLLYSYENGLSGCPPFRLRQIAARLEVGVQDLIPGLSSHCGYFLRGTQKRLRLSAERGSLPDPSPARSASTTTVGR
jgi:transcriptional regulator with XRE-family HTH domain